jgi:hypothetical protein
VPHTQTGCDAEASGQQNDATLDLAPVSAKSHGKGKK